MSVQEGVRLILWLGRDPLAAPADNAIVQALTEVEVTHSDRDRSGFRLIFQSGRNGSEGLHDDPLVANSLLSVNSRVILLVGFGALPEVIMDGLVTRRDYNPTQGQITLTGKDISVALEREFKQRQHPALSEAMIATQIALSYPQYGLLPKIAASPFTDYPSPLQRTPYQSASDWGYLQEMASRYGFVSYCEAGPVALSNTLYWGPPETSGIEQKALSFNLGPVSNVTDLQCHHDGLSARQVVTAVQDSASTQSQQINVAQTSRSPYGLLPERGLQMSVGMPTTGLTATQAYSRAQALVDLAADDTVAVSGTLDSLAYQGVLRARARVGLRGAGFSFDGSYRVRSVTHRIAKGQYSQSFNLSRSELGASSAVVRSV